MQQMHWMQADTMGSELESVWDAMKVVHYQRTIEKLEESLRDTTRLEDAMTAALDTVVHAVHAKVGTLWFYDRFGDGRIHPRAVYGGHSLKGVSLMPGEGIAGQTISSGKPVIIEDCQNDVRWAGKVDSKTGFRTETMICVPLALGKAVFGSIQIINRPNEELFDQQDLEFVVMLAESTSELFQRRGLLREFEEAEGKNLRSDLTFNQIFYAKDEREMESYFYKMDVYSRLRVRDQEAVLDLARQLYRYFGGAETEKKRFGFRR